MKYLIIALSCIFIVCVQANTSKKLPLFLSEISMPVNISKQLKQESLLTAKKWVCLEVSKKRLTKKLDFDIGNEFNLGIDKKYNFKNNNYDYSNGKWKLDGKYLYFFYNAQGTENKVETSKYKVVKLTETTLILKRTHSPRGKITFK